MKTLILSFFLAFPSALLAEEIQRPGTPPPYLCDFIERLPLEKTDVSLSGKSWMAIISSAKHVVIGGATHILFWFECLPASRLSMIWAVKLDEQHTSDPHVSFAGKGDAVSFRVLTDVELVLLGRGKGARGRVGMINPMSKLKVIPIVVDRVSLRKIP